MVDRLQRSRFVANVMRTIEDDFCDHVQVVAPHLQTLARLGALRYWLLNFGDIVAARWEMCDAMSVDERKWIFDSSSSVKTVKPTLRMTDFLSVAQTSQWTNAMCADIFKYWDEVGCHSLPTTLFLEERVWRKREAPPVQESSKRIVISRTYMGRFQELALAIMCRTFPVRWREPILHDSIDAARRQQLQFLRPEHTPGTFDHFVRSILPHYLPQTLIEHFETLCEHTKSVIRKAPKVIFTANLHVASDSFLIWATHQRLHGSQIVCSQHGGLNGQGHVPTRVEEFEQEFPDTYLHWGWSNAERSLKSPAQVLIWKRQRKSSNRKQDLLFITDCTLRYGRRPWSSIHDEQSYKHMILGAYAAIPSRLQSATVVRLHHDHSRYDDSHFNMWTATHPNARLDDGNGSIDKLRRDARVVVCTTLGTSELIQFGMNVPTMLRLDPQLHAVRPMCSELFHEMERIGLVHYSDESFHYFLEKVWDNVDKWWLNDEVQRVRHEYNLRFGHRPTGPLRALSCILRAM